MNQRTILTTCHSLPAKESSHLYGKGTTIVKEKIQFGKGGHIPGVAAFSSSNICITNNHTSSSWKVRNTHFLNESNNRLPNFKDKQKLDEFVICPLCLVGITSYNRQIILLHLDNSQFLFL